MRKRRERGEENLSARIPADLDAGVELLFMYMQAERWNQAEDLAYRLQSSGHRSPWIELVPVRSALGKGMHSTGVARLHKLESSWFQGENGVDLEALALEIAAIHAELNEPEAALHWLRKFGGGGLPVSPVCDPSFGRMWHDDFFRERLKKITCRGRE